MYAHTQYTTVDSWIGYSVEPMKIIHNYFHIYSYLCLLVHLKYIDSVYPNPCTEYVLVTASINL